MTQYGIRSRNTYGASIPAPRTMDKNIKKDHETALRLWKSGIHEARLLAGFMDDPKGVTKGQIESWMKDKAGVTDEKNFVKKAFNVDQRQVGRRYANLSSAVIKAVKVTREIGLKSTRWIVSDTLEDRTGDRDRSMRKP